MFVFLCNLCEGEMSCNRKGMSTNVSAVFVLYPRIAVKLFAGVTVTVVWVSVLPAATVATPPLMSSWHRTCKTGIGTQPYLVHRRRNNKCHASSKKWSLCN